MKIPSKKYLIVLILNILFSGISVLAESPYKLPDTGEIQSYTNTGGEDSDYTINSPAYTDNGNGTVTDKNTGLIWQKTDGGEMTIENARTYPSSLSLGGVTNWRLPYPLELFDINDYSKVNPALNSTYFGTSQAQYWWTQSVAPDDANKIWVVNAGGGIGAHPKTETVSAGGQKKIHVRCVSGNNKSQSFTDNGDETITDNRTGLVWTKNPSTSALSWENALTYAENLSFAGKSDWRLPNIKELFSIVDVNALSPSLNKLYFPSVGAEKIWSSTTMVNGTEKSWYVDMKNGIVTYELKTNQTLKVLCVRGGNSSVTETVSSEMVLIPGGEFEMGDHFGFVDPKHPSDELPLHKVKLDTFYIAKTELTNSEYLDFLNSALSQGLIEVRNNTVFAKGGNDIYCYTNEFAKYYSISYSSGAFKIADFRAKHPVVGVLWFGCAAYCNWLSTQKGFNPCYNLQTWICDFSKNGYRLPTEAEWEYAGRGGNTNPYYNYPWGNVQDKNKANWPQSGDPYEGAGEDLYPQTTPVGFYDGKLHLKTEYNWPGAAASYQTSNGANGYGLYDMAGNVWEFVNDWYGQDYYSKSPYLNPTGPDSSFKMPDGKPYRGMRGGNWYNGYMQQGDTVNDGHSRVSNRNPSYYRGPQDPNHPYYHLGFRLTKKYTGIENRAPVKPDKPLGSYQSKVNETITFIAKTSDPDGDSVYYYFDWGDGNNSGWGTVNKSGTQYSINHSWSNSGIFSVKVKAKDTKNAESEYSDTLKVQIISSPGKYNLSVVSGKGSGTYESGDTVQVIADTPANGYKFDIWTGDTDFLLNKNKDTSLFVMPGKNASVTATYKLISAKYKLTVSSGSGSGSYNIGDTVVIIADKAPKDYKFSKWSGDTMYIIKKIKDTAHVKIPDKDISLTAEYILRTDVSENNFSDFVLYPNPVNDVLFIDGEIIEGNIIIYSVQGEKVKVVKFSPLIDLSDLSSGIYTVIINNKSFKIIKY